jgi:hypothetical protein
MSSASFFNRLSSLVDISKLLFVQLWTLKTEKMIITGLSLGIQKFGDFYFRRMKDWDEDWKAEDIINSWNNASNYPNPVDKNDSNIGPHRKLLRDKIAYIFEDKFLQGFVKGKIKDEFSLNSLIINF